eukprot:503212-Prorocentrum_lima.AAC.1
MCIRDSRSAVSHGMASHMLWQTGWSKAAVANTVLACLRDGPYPVLHGLACMSLWNGGVKGKLLNGILAM